MINIPRYKDQDLKGGSVLQLEDDMITVKRTASDHSESELWKRNFI